MAGSGGRRVGRTPPRILLLSLAGEHRLGDTARRGRRGENATCVHVAFLFSQADARAHHIQRVGLRAAESRRSSAARRDRSAAVSVDAAIAGAALAGAAKIIAVDIDDRKLENRSSPWAPLT